MIKTVLQFKKLSIILLVSLAVISCSSNDEVQATNYLEELVIYSGVNAVRDPLLAKSPEQRFLVSFENRRLFSLNEKGELRPDLANAYTISEDGKELTIKLSNNTFTDGTPITANDVKSTLTRVAVAGGDYSGLVEGIVGTSQARAGQDYSGITIPDDETLIIKLINTDPFFVYHFAHTAMSIVPAKNIDSQSTLTVGVGSGDYHSEDVSNDTNSISVYNPRRSDLPTIKVVRKTAKELRQNIEPEDADIILGRNDSEQFTSFGVNRLAVASWNIFVANRESPLSNPKFRQAILLALDQEEAIEAYGNRAVVPTKFTGDTFDSIDCESYCETNREKAQDLINDIYPDLEVPLITIDIENNALQKNLADSAQKRLNDVGVPSEIREYSSSELSNVIARGDAQLFRFGWVSDIAVGADALVQYFKADSPDNVSGINDEELEKRISKYQSDKTLKDKIESSKEIQSRIKDLWLMRPIAQFQSTVTINDRIGEISFDLYGVLDIKKLRQF